MIFKGTKKFPSLLNNLFSFEYFSQAGVRYKAPCVELYICRSKLMESIMKGDLILFLFL